MSTMFSEEKQLPVSQSKIIKAAFNKHHTAYLKVTKKAAYLAGDNFNFVQASEGGVNIQAGVGKAISLQTMGHQGPFHMKMMWPMNLLCGPFSMPQCIPWPPYVHLLPEVGPMVTVFVGLSCSACWVAEELYGKNDIRTHHARLYTMVHDNFFNRMYKKNGIKWAAFLKRNNWLKPIIKPIWNFMAFKGEQISNMYAFVKTGIELRG